MKKILLLPAIALCLAPLAAQAQLKLKATPFTFDPDNTNSVSAAWVASIGLTDSKGDKTNGLLLQKNTATSTNSAAGVLIEKAKDVGPLMEVGFDYKNGGHCGAGAPRFNILASDGFHFLGGCSNGTQFPGVPVAGWTRVRIDPSNPAQAFPPITPGATIQSIVLIFDEGTDTGPDFTGTVILDNIDINGTLIGMPGSTKP